MPGRLHDDFIDQALPGFEQDAARLERGLAAGPVDDGSCSLLAFVVRIVLDRGTSLIRLGFDLVDLLRCASLDLGGFFISNDQTGLMLRTDSTVASRARMA